MDELSAIDLARAKDFHDIKVARNRADNRTEHASTQQVWAVGRALPAAGQARVRRVAYARAFVMVAPRPSRPRPRRLPRWASVWAESVKEDSAWAVARVPGRLSIERARGLTAELIAGPLSRG